MVFIKTILINGNGPIPKPGDKVNVDYKVYGGYLADSGVMKIRDSL